MDLNIPSISNEQKEHLDTPIPEEEIRSTILPMKTGKSSVMYGFPVEYYKKCVAILAPILPKVYREAFEIGPLPDSFNDILMYHRYR